MAPPTTVLALLSVIATVTADTFVWRKSSNWGDPSNWNQTRLPCAAETVKLTRPITAALSPNPKFEVRVDVNVTLKRLVLPPGSSLKLNKGVKLTLSRSTTCKVAGLSTISDTSVNEFIGVQPHPWNCANNWERLSDKMQATRVPCASDTVEFPAGNSYSWVALSTDVKVAGLMWQGKSVQSLSEIPNADSYFVKSTPSAKITVNAACATSPSSCPCLSNNCSFYPTSPPPPTTRVATTKASTTAATSKVATTAATTVATTKVATKATVTRKGTKTMRVATMAPGTKKGTKTMKVATMAPGTKKGTKTMKVATMAPGTRKGTRTVSVATKVPTSTAGTKTAGSESTTGTPCNPRDIGCKPVVICPGDTDCNTVPPPSCAPDDSKCANNAKRTGSNTGSDSTTIWPIIVGVLIGVVGLLIIVIAGMIVLRSRRRSHSVPYEKEETRSPNAHYSPSQDDPKVHLSFENPMYSDARQTIDNEIYDHQVDKSLFEIEPGSTEGIYQEFDEDGLPI